MNKGFSLRNLFKSWAFTPGPKQIADQLRKPSGKLGKVVGEKMNVSNAGLYDFVLDLMDLKEADSILEIGFGNGLFFEKIFSKAKNIKVSGIDYSQTMLKLARQLNHKWIEKGKLNLDLGDCEVLPYKEKSFEKVFCINVVYFWNNPVDNLMEIHRVLKPGGKFYTGIRDKDSMKLLNFTQYGFTMYDEDSWRRKLRESFFEYFGVTSLAEEEIEFEGQKFKPKGLCLIAQKPSNA